MRHLATILAQFTKGARKESRTIFTISVVSFALIAVIGLGFESNFGVATLQAQNGGDENRGGTKGHTFTADDAKPKFHTGRIIVKYFNEDKPRVVPAANPKAAVDEYSNDPDVEYAEVDAVIQADALPTDELAATQWNMFNISAPSGWDLQNDASNVVVAVVDSGIDYSHPDLMGNLWTAGDGSHGFTCMGGCYAGGADNNGHGTHLAGIIGATGGNGIGVAGVNWRVKLLSIKFLDSQGSGFASDAAAAYQKLAALKASGVNIRVSNNSWSASSSSQAVADAMASLEAAGVVNVNSAGNGNQNSDMVAVFPAAYRTRGGINVLASDALDQAAGTTNYGLANVDIAAPGVNVPSTIPVTNCVICDITGYKSLSGTSIATPHVSGAVAGLLARYPNLTAAQARDVVLDPGSYDTLSDPKGRLSTTGGRLNLNKLYMNPLGASPRLNNFPTLTMPANVTVAGGAPVSLSAYASDPDGDVLRSSFARYYNQDSYYSQSLFNWAVESTLPPANSDNGSFTAPSFSRTASIPYVASVTDNRGGGKTGATWVTVTPSVTSGSGPSGSFSVTPLDAAVGAPVVVSYNPSDPDGTPVAWDVWIGQNGQISHQCCFTNSSQVLTFSAPGAYRISVGAIDRQLQEGVRQTAVVHVGGGTGTPPIASLNVSTLSGPAPLTVSVNSSGSSAPDGGLSVQLYSGSCYGVNSVSCTFSSPGTYVIVGSASDSRGQMDMAWKYVVVTPSGSGGGGTGGGGTGGGGGGAGTAPSVAITSPASGATVAIKSKVAIAANATAGSNPVSRVDISVAGKVVCSDTSSPYSCSWTVPNGKGKSYALKAVVYDSAGASATSATVTVISK